jgi:hypothetical protein
MNSDKNILILKSVLTQLDELDSDSEKVTLRLELIKEKIQQVINNDLNNPLDITKKEKIDSQKNEFSEWIRKKYGTCDCVQRKIKIQWTKSYKVIFDETRFSSSLYHELNNSDFCFCRNRTCSRFKKTFPEDNEKENLAKFIRENYKSCNRFINEELCKCYLAYRKDFIFNTNDIFCRIKDLCSYKFYLYFIFTRPFCLCDNNNCNIEIPNENFTKLYELIKFNQNKDDNCESYDWNYILKHFDYQNQKEKYTIIHEFSKYKICICGKNSCSYWKPK